LAPSFGHEGELAVHRKDSPLATRSRELKGTPLGESESEFDESGLPGSEAIHERREEEIYEDEEAK